MAAQRTSPDWLAFRTQAEVLQSLDALRGLFGVNGQDLTLEHLPHGKDGFRQGAALKLLDMPFGRVDFGGESQRGWVRWNITGKGCDYVKDWDALDAVEALPSAELRRLDIQMTTWAGEVRHDDLVNAHTAGRFCAGGRPPDMRQILSSNPRAGRTVYVGKRESDKFFRGYEKGFEMAAAMGAWGAEQTHIEGHPIEDIYRCEVELKSKTKIIPWEAVERRDQYFAGSYPFLADLLPDVEGDILLNRPERAAQTELMAALENVRVQYGATIFTALAAYGGDMCKVWDKIIATHHNKALLEAGVLLVEHE